jgi:hypothetical protein
MLLCGTVARRTRQLPGDRLATTRCPISKTAGRELAGASRWQYCDAQGMVGKKEEAARLAVRAALDSWNWRPPQNREEQAPSSMRSGGRSSNIRTELSTTVFSAEPEDWVRYLQLPLGERYQSDVKVHVHLQRAWRLIAFEAENEQSRWLAELLDEGVRRAHHRLEPKPHVLRAFDELVFGDMNGQGRSVNVHLSPHVPSDGTREAPFDDSHGRSEVRIVLHSRLVQYVREALEGSSLTPDQKLGLYWPLISRLISELAYPTAPLDRFAAKIAVFAKLSYVTLSILYDGRKGGRLHHSPAGEIYAGLVSQSSGIARDKLEDQHPYFRMLSSLSFLLRGEPYASYAEEVRIAAREYLDTVYLRLSLSGAMPEIPSAMQPMPFERHGKKIRTPKPELGRYGIQDRDDLDAWKAVDGPFKDLGFTLLRQLGIGEFGRVYEVLNEHNSRHPARVALKVDRISGKKKKAILEAEQAMHIGRALAKAHHLIRLYDTGKLRGERYTYHVLQLIDGDTLDNLVGVTGTEHASVSRPPRARSSEGEGEAEVHRALSLSGAEIWRRQRLSLPFAHALSPAMLLDLLSSVLLWLNDVHEVNYAINDLKNGNLMMSRRGQLKGIDLDSYAPVHSPRDKVTDFMFLAVSLVLLLLSARGAALTPRIPWEELIENETRLRQGLMDAWPFGDVAALSDGRVSETELLNVLVDLVHRSRRLVYTKRPDLFTEDLQRLISIKRRLLPEEMIID